VGLSGVGFSVLLSINRSLLVLRVLSGEIASAFSVTAFSRAALDGLALRVLGILMT